MADEAKAKGNAAFFAGRFDEAIRFFSEAINLAPSNRSAAYASLNCYADTKKTVKIKLDWSKGYSSLDAAHLVLDSAEEAIAAYRKSLDLDLSNEALKSGLADAQAASRSRVFWQHVLGAGVVDEAHSRFDDEMVPRSVGFFANSESGSSISASKGS